MTAFQSHTQNNFRSVVEFGFKGVISHFAAERVGISFHGFGSVFYRVSYLFAVDMVFKRGFGVAFKQHVSLEVDNGDTQSVVVIIIGETVEIVRRFDERAGEFGFLFEAFFNYRF